MEQTTTTTTTGAAPSAVPGLPPGTVREAHRYVAPDGAYRTSRVPVPVDEFGRLTGVPFRCRRCSTVRWMPAGKMKAGTPAPMCPVHERAMQPVLLRRAPLLPYRAVWDAVERPLRPVWALPVLAGAAAGLDAGNVPALACAAAVPLAGEVARRVYRRREIARQVRLENLDPADPQAHKRRRAAIDRAARTCGYAAAGAAGWLAVAAGLGVDPDTVSGAVAWSSLLPAWLAAAGTWWYAERHREKPRLVVADPEPEPEGPQVDPGEAEVRRIWDGVLAYRQGDVVGRGADGEAVRAKRDAKLAGTVLEDWHRVSGGWAATLVGPIGAYESETFLKAVGAIASAFSVKKSMVTVIPDPEDENRSTVMIQRVSPITETPQWAGPNSIDVQRGVAPVMVYADGEPVQYEIYRRGWGTPHVLIVGSTGVAKSSFVELLFTIDRWTHHKGRGLVADFLIDPQQGQSFPAFLDELAAPAACSLPEALMLVRALTREALRRNRYLAREARWWDERRKKWRTGRKWWDPLLDGPILALTIDEAHDYLSNREFSTAITKAGRMWRKCGMQVRIATHTPLLADLGGSMALRDMLSSGFVWVGRTANSLTGPVAFNGRLPVDPRQIPALPGMAYPLAGANPKPMLARTMWEEDWYDWLRDENDQQIGYPAVLPAETLEAFGPEYAGWVATLSSGGEWSPALAGPIAPPASAGGPESASTGLVAAVFEVLAAAGDPLDMAGLDAGLRQRGVEGSVLAVRAALRQLRDDGLVAADSERRYELTALGWEQAGSDRVAA